MSDAASSTSRLVRVARATQSLPLWQQMLIACGGLTGLSAFAVAISEPTMRLLSYMSDHPIVALVLLCVALVAIESAILGTAVWKLWGTVVALRQRLEEEKDSRSAQYLDVMLSMTEAQAQSNRVLTLVADGQRQLISSQQQLSDQLCLLREIVQQLHAEKHPTEQPQTGAVRDAALMRRGDPLVTTPFPSDDDPRTIATVPFREQEHG